MPKLEMGTGYKTLVYLLVWVLLFGSGIFVGKNLQKHKQSESNNKVISIDSEIGQTISSDTRENKEKLDEQIKNLKEPIVDSNGYMSDKFMQLMESAKSNAEQRGNETGIIHSLTHP